MLYCTESKFVSISRKGSTMPTWQAIQSRQHINSGWRPPTNYRHAKQDALAPLTISELSQALPHYSLAFTQMSGEYQLVAILSLQSGVNLFVDANNRWQAPYIPACYRSYPFNLLPNQKGDLVVCIDSDSGLFHEQAQPDDKPLFNADGQPTETLQKIIDFMQQRHKQQILTQQAVNQLTEHNLIHPWPVQIKRDDDVQDVKGLFRIDEKSLKALQSDALSNMMQSGGIAIAYAQLFSMNQINQLAERAKYHARQQSKPEEPDIEKLFGNDDILSFDNI
jgi:hypothetical protein